MRSAAATLRTLPRAVALVPRAALRLPPHLRRRLALLAALALTLASAHLLWFRDSSLVRVQRVSVTGLTTADAPRVRAALVAAARDMTTLHLRRDSLERAVAGYPVVRSIEATPDFPHALRISVVEHRPAALLVVGGARVVLSSDGTVLRGVQLGGPLPLIRAAHARLPARSLENPALVPLLGVVAAAPAVLDRRIASVRRTRREGIVVRLRRGPRLIFGDASRTGAKWVAASGVLADPASKGASYVDLRLPDRPAAGGLGATAGAAGGAVQSTAPATALGATPSPAQAAPTTATPQGQQAAPTAGVPGQAPGVGTAPVNPQG